MPVAVAAFAWLLLGQAAPAENPILRGLLDRGIEVDGVRVPLPAPTLADDSTAEAGRSILKAIAGDDRAAANFTRDSVTAPFVLKTRDVAAGAATIRAADLWFVVRGKLDEIDLKQTLKQAEESTVEAGNMRVTTRLLKDDDRDGRNLDLLPEQAGREEWLTRSNSRLLDRIRIQVTDHAVATRTPRSLTLASKTSRAFDAEAPDGNHWSAITRANGKETEGPPQAYAGGGSYVKITELAAVPGALFVEAHFAFVEPHAWFDGNPILRSKFSLICQDQVRQLRREIQKRRGEK